MYEGIYINAYEYACCDFLFNICYEKENPWNINGYRVGN